VNDFTRFLVIAVLIALGAVWIEITRAQTMRELPEATGPGILDDTRTRVESWWDARHGPAEPPATTAAPGDVSAQLANLADLHARGELSDEEYASAKARIISGQ
jgi:hypothetical protein